jgi:tetratricopeptide (TPR) repeat protein
MSQLSSPVEKRSAKAIRLTSWLLSLFALLLVLGTVLWWYNNSRAKRTERNEPIRISGVIEPPEMLIPPRGQVFTDEQRRYAAEISKFTSANQNDPSRFDAMIRQFPDAGDLYELRAVLRCTGNDMRGAKDDLDQALTKTHRILDNGSDDKIEMMAMRAKLELAQDQNQAALGDVARLLDSYTDNIGALSGGVTKLTDKPSSVCEWTPADIETLKSRTKNDPRSIIFAGIVYSAIGEYDKNAVPLADEAFAEASSAGSLAAETAFYKAVGAQEVAAFSRLAYSDSEKETYNRQLIDLYSAALNANPQIAAAYSRRAEAYYELKDWAHAIPDYDQAIRLKPTDSGLWNDRGLTKEETFDKNGAIEDYTQAIKLKSTDGSENFLASTFENRADLYVKLGEYQKAIGDYSQDIGQKLSGEVLMVNLDRFRALYPEYRPVDDSRLIDKLHRLYYPNFTDDDFRKQMYKPTNDTSNLILSETYLKRADAYLAAKDFTKASADYKRSTLVFTKNDADTVDYDRWRTPPGLTGVAIDVPTLRTTAPGGFIVWVRSVDADGTWDGVAPIEYRVDCATRKVGTGDSSKNWIDPPPSSREEVIRDFFCQ